MLNSLRLEPRSLLVIGSLTPVTIRVSVVVFGKLSGLRRRILAAVSLELPRYAGAPADAGTDKAGLATFEVDQV